MNPIHWFFAHIFHYIRTVKPDAIVDQLPVATLFVINVLLLTPIIQIVLLIETIFNINIGAIGIVGLWLMICMLNRYLLLGKDTVAKILVNYPVKPTSKNRAKAFFGMLVFFTLLMKLFPLARMLQ
jgi:hypothetical protein